MTVYQLWEDNEAPAAGGSRLRYGVAVYSGGEPRRVAGDLTDSRERAEAFVRLLNEEALDPVHFDQAIEDFLYDFSV